jgi:hypothetical protein
MMIREDKMLEYSKIIGQPLDPRKPHPEIVKVLCNLDTAEPNEYAYYYDALLETEVIHTITSSGEVTQSKVTPDTPVALTFADFSTPEYYMLLKDLASAKEKTLMRKKRTITRALDTVEAQAIVTLLAAATTSSGNEHGLTSNQTKFRFENLIDMVEDVTDYGGDLYLVAGATIFKDKSLWNYDINKNQSVLEAYKALNIKEIRIPSTMTMTLDGASTDVISSSVGYLVATDTSMEKPLLFVRKKIGNIEGLEGIMMDTMDTERQRMVMISPNPVQLANGTKRYWAIGIGGWEEFVGAVVNQYAISEFTRA